MSLGGKLRQLRMRKGKSLQKAADDIGISKAHLWELESGGSGNPSMELLKRLADYYSVGISWLVGEEETEEDDQTLKALFRNLRDLDSKDREMIQDLIEASRKRSKKP